jgi:hypothetical protein
MVKRRQERDRVAAVNLVWTWAENEAARPSDALVPGHVSRLQSGGAKQQAGRRL